MRTSTLVSPPSADGSLARVTVPAKAPRRGGCKPGHERAASPAVSRPAPTTSTTADRVASPARTTRAASGTETGHATNAPAAADTASSTAARSLTSALPGHDAVHRGKRRREPTAGVGPWEGVSGSAAALNYRRPSPSLRVPGPYAQAISRGP